MSEGGYQKVERMGGREGQRGSKEKKKGKGELRSPSFEPSSLELPLGPSFPFFPCS